ncbi:MAG TPA: UDP-N-acetylmuramoyl-L-alanine--D-glutamate ligase [Limnochordia bacterium]|nr:UDP-N-acetylmuramoyl-L-alanine--D-glutamate ligase [Limnochordia bacterium]
MQREYFDDWSGKRVAVIGLGISNMALIRFLTEAGALVNGRDHKTGSELGERFATLQSLGIELILGPSYLAGLTDFDVVMVSPGVPKDLPELREVAGLGRLTSEIALVFRYSKGPIYGITGSSGKTTTTSFVREILKESKVPAYVGGNIGVPLIDQMEHIGPEDQVVLELSSFQLEGLRQSPHGAVITNIAQNHLDVHHTMENYISAKKTVYRYQKADDFLVLNYDDPRTRAMEKEAPGQVFFFSLTSQVSSGAFADGDDLVYTNGTRRFVFAKRSELALPGQHNVANFLAATLLSHGAGASLEAARRVGQTFAGVPHRLEHVGDIKGVRYYNDSIATTPDRTMAALCSFAAPLILIAGGSDKQLSFDDLGKDIASRVKHLILLGTTGPKIRQAVPSKGGVSIDEVEDLEEAVALAHRLGEPGDVVLLSPASASFDQYVNFVARGTHFRELVARLDND